MKNLLFATLLVFLLTLAGAAQNVCKRNVEPVGGFSFCVPDGWGVVEKEGQKYKIVYGPREDVFTPNINVKDEANTAPLADYVAASIKYILDHYQQVGATSVKVIAQASFMTTGRTPGIKVTLRTEYKGLIIRTLQYYFNGKAGEKLIVTCTALEAEQAALDPVFERALKTFQLDK